jgi:DNA ligase D-like protein (predicted ligase)
MFPGATVDAATRKAVASLRDSRANWSADELTALNDVAKGSPTQRALRMVGALAPNSPITTLLHAGGLLGGTATGGLVDGRLARNDGDRSGGQDGGQSAHELGGQQSEQHHPIGGQCADDGCAYGAICHVAFGGVAHGLGGQRAPTSATLCPGARGGVPTMPRVIKRSASQALKAGPSRRDAPLPSFVPPQLSQPVEKPPSGPQWLHEIKLDGFRMAARIDNGRVQLLTRTGLDWTAKYPSAIAALANLKVNAAYLDGELCGVDDAGLPNFARTQAATDGERGARLVYYAFDLLHINGWDVSALPLIERKKLLEPLLANKPGLQFNGHETGDGELILEHAGKLGFEGVVSKTIDAPYAPRNRGLWRKAKWLNRQEFVVVGWSDPEGTRPHLGALLLGYYTDDGKLIYAGRVGTGMPDKVLADLRRRLEPLSRTKSPLNVPPPRKTRFGSPLVLSRVHWVEPKLVAEITYLTWTADNLLRQGGQTGGPGAARSRTGLIGGSGQGSINQRQT